MANFGFEYRKTDSGIVIEKYRGSDSVVDVPPRITGLPVVEIVAEAFSGCTELTKIFLPDGLKSIDERAFVGCSSLTEIHWRDLLIKIDGDEFKICAGTPTEIHLPRFLIHLGDTAISPTPDNFDAHQELLLLDDFDEEKPPPTPVDRFEYRKTYSGDGIVIKDYHGADSLVVIPNEIEGLPVLGIDMYAFCHCNSLTEINFPAGLKFIGTEAFCDCHSLTEINFPAGLEFIGSDVFLFCDSLTKIHFPSGLESMGNHQFAFESLKDVYVPKCLSDRMKEFISGYLPERCRIHYV